MADAREFDWIDDAFDDKRTAEDMARAKGTGIAGIALVVVLVIAVLFSTAALFMLAGVSIASI